MDAVQLTQTAKGRYHPWRYRLCLSAFFSLHLLHSTEKSEAVQAGYIAPV